MDKVGQVKEGLGLAYKLILGLFAICSIIISIGDVTIDAGDAVVDSATVGVGGAITGILDLVSEFVLEFLQLAIIFLFNWIVGKGSFTIGFKIPLILAIVDFILSFAMIFIPVGDWGELLVEVIGEFVKNALILDALIKVLIFG